MNSSSDHGKLRPYYNEAEFASLYNISYSPGEGVIDHRTGKSISLSLPTTLQYNNQQIQQGGILKIGIKGLKKPVVPVQISGDGKGKDIYSDLEFQEYFDFNNFKELIKNLFHSFIRNYLRVLTSEPFEVVRLISQVGAFNTSGTTGVGSRKVLETMALDDLDDDDDEEINFFSSTPDVSVSSVSSPQRSRIRRKSNIERSIPSIRNSMTLNINDRKLKKNHIKPVSLKTLDLMSALLSKEGTKGLWRGINTSFIYKTLARTIEAWLSGFLSPFLNIPDPFFIDIVHSTSPFKSLCLSIVVGVLTVIILQPIDLIRLKFIVTSTNLKDKRSFRRIITSFQWRDFCIPFKLIIPTLNFSLASIFWKKYTPYLLCTKFNVDSYSSPILFAMTNLWFSVVELFTKLPLEVLLRRAQLDYMLNDPSCNNELHIENDELSIQFAGYFGYLPTLYYIYKGTIPSYAIDQNSINEEWNENKGLDAIFRGWKVGLVNVMGSWGLNLLQDNVQKEESF